MARHVAISFLLLLAVHPAFAQEKVLRIGMTLADIPWTHGQPNQGYEGNRFTGIPVYDSLVAWDLSSATRPTRIIPGLAISWKVDEKDRTRWIFKLRPNVKFHDGSPFNADAVVWNADKVLRKEAPQFDPSQIGVTSVRMPTLQAARKIDDLTVELKTSEPDSLMPFNLTHLYIASPAQWEKKWREVSAALTDRAERSKAAWRAFSADFSGTGPFKLARLVPRERLELVKNPAYWNHANPPRIDRVVLLPIPEPSARTAALLAGQVDWIEAPATDAIDTIQARGFKVYTNLQPHIWPWQFAMGEGSPFRSRDVRHAANLCLDRGGLKKLLHGQMVEATGFYEPGHPWRGTPNFNIRYDVDAARKLMSRAGYSASRPATVKVQISTSGSGQMQPLSMNEFIQQSLKDCFFNVEFDVVEWNALYGNWRLGAKDKRANGANAINVSVSTMDPWGALVRFVSTKSFPPASNNWGYFTDPKVDALIEEARNSFEDSRRDAALAKLHSIIVDEAPFLFVAHDISPRAVSPRVKGVITPQSWFVDFTTVSMD